jgi:hypothetical protein
VALTDLNETERGVVRECLQAAAEGPFFPDWEFPTLFGIDRDQVRQLLLSWPKVDEADDAILLSINNSFNNLLGYPNDMHEEWAKWISVTEGEVARIFAKWKGKDREAHPSSRRRDYFDNLM